MKVVRDGEEAAKSRTAAKLRQFLAAATVSLLCFCFGAVVGWSSPMQTLLASPHPPVGTDPMPLDTFAWLGSINHLGSMAGGLFWGVSADRLGRKFTACCVAVPFIFSWLFIYVASTAGWLFVARFMAGVSCTGARISVPVFISEIAQDDYRGRFTALGGIAIDAGVLYSFVLGGFLGYHGLAIGAGLVPVLFLLVFIWMPESPVQLYKKGKIQKAEKALLWYRGGDENVAKSVLSSYNSLPKNFPKNPSLKSLIATRGTVKALIIGLCLVTNLQTSGFYSIRAYAGHIFTSSGASFTPEMGTICIGSVQLICAAVSTLFLDRWGRKPLVLFSLISMCLVLAVLGTFLFFSNEPGVQQFSYVPLVCLTVYFAGFSLGFGTAVIPLLGEIFPPEIKGLAISCIMFYLEFLAFVNIKMFPIFQGYLNLYGVFWLYSVCCLGFILFFVWFLPETKGLAPHVILRILNNEPVPKEQISEEEEKLRTSDKNNSDNK